MPRLIPLMGLCRPVARISLLGTMIGSVASAQSALGSQKWVDSARTLIDAGMKSNDPGALDPALALLERVLTVVPNDGALLHYRGYALYRKATLMQSRGKADELKAVLDEADRALDQSGKVLAWPETFALRASVFGQMISANPGPITAMRYGPKSDQEMDRAVALGPTNPRVFLLRGIGNIFKPALFGGGADKAEKDLLKAIALFPNDKPAPLAPAWGHAEAYAWLGQVHVKQNRLDDARAAYQKALEIQPDFGWVTYVLLPELEKKKR